MSYNFETKEELLEFLKSEEGEGYEVAETLKKPLVQKRDELLGEIKDVRAKANKFNDIDLDELQSKAEKAEQLQNQPEELKNKSQDGDEKYDQLKSSLEERIQEERDKLNKFVDRYKQTRVENVISEAVSKHKGITDLLKPVLRNRIKENVTEDGDVEIEVLTKDGKPYYVNGEEATIEDLVKELKNDEVYSRCFEGTGASGTGTRPNNGKNQGNSLDPNDPNYSLTEAMKAASKRK